MPNIGKDPEAKARVTVNQRNSATVFVRASAEEEERRRRRKHQEYEEE